MLPKLFFVDCLVATAFATPFIVNGGPAWCTQNPSGGGPANDGITKDCCAAVKHKAYFNEYYKTCMGHGGQIDNAVDHGKFGKCCDSRGGGSHGVATGANEVFAPH